MPESVYFNHCELLTRGDGSLWELGSGITGTVYKGFDTRMQVPVALKIVHSACVEGEGARQRFAEAALRARGLHHRHIASVLHVDEHREKCAYSMKFVDGESLDVVLERQGKLPVPLALKIVAQVSSALDAAARGKIIHGNLKPSNVMLEGDDDEPAVQVLDFGLGRRSFAGIGVTDTAGLSDYASPEQRDGGEIDVRSDVYSLGVVFRQMLTGENPRQIISEPLPSEEVDDLPGSVVQLLGQMLEKDPARRPQSPDALHAEIERCRVSRDAAALSQIGRLEPMAPSSVVAAPIAPPPPVVAVPVIAPPPEPSKEAELEAPVGGGVSSASTGSLASDEPPAVATFQRPPVSEPAANPPEPAPEVDPVIVPETGTESEPSRTKEARPGILNATWFRAAVVALLLGGGALGYFAITSHRRRPPADLGSLTAPAETLETQQRWPEALEAWLQISRTDPRNTASAAGAERALRHIFPSSRAFLREDFDGLRGKIDESARRGIGVAKSLQEANQLLVTADQAEENRKWREALATHTLLAGKYAEFGFGQPALEAFFGRMNDHLADISPADFEAMRADIEHASQQGVTAAGKVISGQFMQEVAMARNLEAQQKWREALAAWLHLAKTHPQALPQLKLCLASLTNLSPGLTPEEFTAMRPDITEAAQSFGISFAQLLLGDQLRQVEPKASFNWYTEAAKSGEPVAMVRAAQMLFAGVGTAPNPVEAAVYLKMAVDKGYIRAIAMLGECYLVGNGVAKDEKHAVALLRQASEADDRDAKTTLAACYDKGQGVEPDDNEAFKLFSEAEKLGDGLASLNLGMLLAREEKDIVVRKGEKRAFKPNREMADKKFLQAFEKFKGDTEKGLGGNQAMYFRALCHEKGLGCPVDLEAATVWYVKAAVAGSPKAADWCKEHRVPLPTG